MTTPMNGYRIAALLCSTMLVAACEKNTVQVLPADSLLASRIKFFNFGVNAPGVNFYADAIKLTAIQSGTGAEATTGVAYGGVGNGGAYSQIGPGSHTLTGRIAAATDKDLPIATVAMTIADGKFYSYYMTGFYDAVGKTSDAFVLEDGYPATIDWSVALVRLVHTIPNANPLTLYAANTITNDTLAVGGAVAYKSGGAFTALPPGVYNLFARYTDSTTNRVTRTGVSLFGGHVYTIGARGDITITSTTATNRPFLDNTANR
jgi:hypothetical protein